MKQLKAELKSMHNGALETARLTNISPILARGLIKNGGIMSTEMMITASQPRDQAITLDRAKQAWHFLQLLTSLRKRKNEWCRQTETMGYRSEYSIPEGMTQQQVINGLIEMVKPCSPTVTAHFVRLNACKPFFDSDPDKIAIVFESLYDDLKDYPEVAVVLGLDDVRKTEGKYFPTSHEIIKEVSEYRDLIYDLLDFFRENK